MTMSRQHALAGLLVIAALLLAFWLCSPSRRSADLPPEESSSAPTPALSAGALTDASAVPDLREEVDWILNLPEPNTPTDAPFGNQPIEFVLQVSGAGQPIREAEVRYGPHTGVTDGQGVFRWPRFLKNANLEIRHSAFTRFSGWAHAPQMKIGLVSGCRVEILVRNGLIPVPDQEVTALVGGGHFSGRLFEYEECVVARGRTDAHGWFSADADFVQMEEGGVGYLEIEVRSAEARPPWIFNVHRSAQQDHNRWIFKTSVDIGEQPPGIRAYAEWFQSGQPAAPVANWQYSWRSSSAETCLWRDGVFDAYGFAELSPSFEKGGEISLRTPGGRWWSSAATAAEWRDAQNLVLRIQDRQATVRCTGAALPPGVRLQACQVAFTDESRGWNRLREVWRPDLKTRTDWTDLIMHEPSALHGGWTGDRIGVVIRALPGGIPLMIEECNADGYAEVQLPELSVLELDGTHLPADWASTQCYLLPAEYAGQRLAGPFYLANGRMVLILPHGQYKIVVSGLTSPAEFPIQVNSPRQRAVLPWK